MTATNREFDLVLLGATGFTGRLVAEHLTTAAARDGVRWAVAGRNENKLDDVMRSIDAEDVPKLIVDSEDADSVSGLARRASVICTTVGPYSLYGSALVAACAREGTHYCDLAGEVHWIARMIEVHHDSAVASGARIVHCCGFDSVPSDLGVWFLQREAKARFGAPMQKVSYRLKAARGTASGGTVASLMQVIEAARGDRDVARTVRHPYSFNPAALRTGPDRPEPMWPSYDDDFQSWTAPFVMGAINTKVVRRTNAILGSYYGEEFRYSEAVLTGGGLTGQAKAMAMASGLNALMIGAAIKPTRYLLNKFVLPSPGQGPGEHQRNNGFFNIALYGANFVDQSIQAVVTADRDPGYGATSRMLGEAALALVENSQEHFKGGGVLTPAAALGDNYIERLEKHAGMTFWIKE
ncbi:MAG: saccharopine dehydrogenase NADP-binding domain-containing protein [Pseudomonadota bacterium]